MNAKAYLMQVKMLDAKINAKLEELQHLKDMVTKVTPTMSDGGSGSGRLDKFDATIAKIIDLEAEINQSIDEYIDRKQDVDNLLEKLEDPDQYQVLHSRYILHKSFERISCDMHMTYRNACYIHGKGLESVEAIVKSLQ